MRGRKEEASGKGLLELKETQRTRVPPTGTHIPPKGFLTSAHSAQGQRDFLLSL